MTHEDIGRRSPQCILLSVSPFLRLPPADIAALQSILTTVVG